VAGRVSIDTETTLAGIPAKDPTIRAPFDAYRFAEYKEKVIDLLAPVVTVSFETVRIMQAIRDVGR